MSNRESLPAFPTPGFLNERPIGSTEGLSRRELFAAMMLQSLMSGVSWDSDDEAGLIALLPAETKTLVNLAVLMADLLSQRLNEQ